MQNQTDMPTGATSPVISGLVSTIIPVYNRVEMLRQAVGSVLAQSYRPIEIIIVDDGSTDATGAEADKLAGQHPDEIRVLHIDNGGAGLAREAGRKAARGEFIQYLDSDDLLLPEKFSVQVAALNEHPECGIAYGYTRLIDIDGNILKAPYKWTDRPFDTLFPALLVDRWWNTHTPLFRRSVCDAVGPWSGMRMSEDWEYEARIAALGVKLVHCPQFLSDTRQHSADRITAGSSTFAHCRDMTRLVASLYVGAMKAGVDIDCPEMKHFSRWAFLEARRAGVAGLAGEAKACFDIAVRAAGAPDKTLRLYGLMARFLGWRLAGRITGLLERLLGRGPGAQTQELSWSDNG
ncbi:glycosyltransferase family 2 protein [Mariprofundus ferrooxydans]|uniref:Glycosyl transferase, family 2 n=1 Tax=Mariprofundus ferrooxydans PV-1 TaxID=314345 RepID=Q0EZB0_9PROT|nr:glycosyltransferase family A protein [Mariprofundus ferrooxydans]EAU54514.1 Glycosyl transferase, family 2 [Mariprofundus ferrooxydans PV-1]